METAIDPVDDSLQAYKAFRYPLAAAEQDKQLSSLAALIADICQVPVVLIVLTRSGKEYIHTGFGLVPELHRYSFLSAAGPDQSVRILEDLETTPGQIMDKDGSRARFFACVPLIHPVYKQIGAVCLLNNKPGQLTEQQQSMLRVLSEQVLLVLRAGMEITADSDADAFGKKMLAINNKIISIVSHEIKAPVALLKTLIDYKKSENVSMEELSEMVNMLYVQLATTLESLEPFRKNAGEKEEGK
ncbi:GAF domain-containing protein [Sediminibacterium ginsengisoli]|uniref:GAF domain-containing protein n=1 Tax=Sediminibacterium ginsengisoli TaxID=413434 RepID=A0A1T4R8F9_9BACT|nr:GAF domain-containing protein [Sediminibacterium ginsengisoli]SKA12370.1 hypothetical protein SAMN04488132_11132 [Sediminibacterium ginsengisoli]